MPLSTRTRQRRFVGLTFGITAVAVGLAVWAFISTATESEHQRHELCVQVEHIKSEIRYTIQRSSRTLPNLAYYKSHPRELAAALEANRQILDTFAPIRCEKGNP